MTSHPLVRLALPLLVAAIAARAENSGEPTLPRGAVIVCVACTADPEQSYALYLPSCYDPTRTWPIVYGFDPLARGAFVVERFRDAAEERGWIIAVSNNSRNGRIEPNVAAANAVFRDTQERFTLDRRRVVLAGHSGAGTLVLALSAHLDLLGAIVSGAPGKPDYTPHPRSAAIYGTAGIDDFNYPSMRQLDHTFAEQSLPHRLVIVESGHAWLPPDEAREALLWMDLQAMRRGAIPRDEKLLTTMFEQRLSATETLPVPARFLELRSLAADFDQLLDTSRAATAATALAGHRDIKAWEKREQALEARQDDETGILLERAAAGDTDEIDERLAGLKRSSMQTKDAEASHLARRILGGASISAVERGWAALAASNRWMAVNMFELRTRIEDTSPRPFLDLARAHARWRARGPALAALTRAQELGLDVAEHTGADTDFAFLRDDPGYQRLIASPPPQKP